MSIEAIELLYNLDYVLQTEPLSYYVVGLRVQGPSIWCTTFRPNFFLGKSCNYWYIKYSIRTS